MNTHFFRIAGRCFATGLGLLFSCFLIAQSAPKDTFHLPLTAQGLTLSMTGELNQTNTIPFARFQAMKQQANAPFINMGFADHMRYTIHLSNGTDTLSFNQWEPPQALVWLTYQRDSIGLFINAFKNPKINFSESHKAENEGKIRTINPPAFELINMLLYLSDYGENERLPFAENQYSKEVDAYFEAYRSHSAVSSLNSWFAQVGSADAQNQLYYTLRMDALGYEWTEDGFSPLEHLQYIGGKNGIQGLLKDIEDFAKVSDFARFYQQNQPIYEQARQQFENQVEAAKVKAWLDERSNQQYHALTTVLVTLSNGLHNTRKFTNHGFTELYMIISAPNSQQQGGFRSKASLTRQLFTELDHHYVNPAGMAQKARVNKAMPSPENWYQSSKWGGYHSKLSIFMEYMTWSLFSAYAIDSFPADQVPEIREQHVKFMVEKRHFSRFKPFEKAVVAFHESKNGDYQIEELVAHMIDWTRNYEPGPGK